MIEQTAHQFSGGVQSGYSFPFGIEHLAAIINAQSTEGEGDPTGHPITEKGWGVDRLGPIGFWWRDPRSMLAVENGRILFAVLHRGVVCLNRLD